MCRPALFRRRRRRHFEVRVRPGVERRAGWATIGYLESSKARLHGVPAANICTSPLPAHMSRPCLNVRDALPVVALRWVNHNAHRRFHDRLKGSCELVGQLLNWCPAHGFGHAGCGLPTARSTGEFAPVVSVRASWTKPSRATLLLMNSAHTVTVDAMRSAMNRRMRCSATSVMPSHWPG